jgi:hypothetical protein
MIPEYFALIGGLLGALGGFYYLYQTLIGKTKPNRVTWFMWALFPMIAFVAQLSQGVGSLAWVTFFAGLTPLLIFLASFVNKMAYWKTKATDYFLLSASLLSVWLWSITDNANIALVIAIVADLFAAVPTYQKAWYHPQSESWVAYAISTAGFFLSLLAIQTYDFQNLAFVIYVLLLNGSLALLSAREPPSRREQGGWRA